MLVPSLVTIIADSTLCLGGILEVILCHGHGVAEAVPHANVLGLDVVTLPSQVEDDCAETGHAKLLEGIQAGDSSTRLQPLQDGVRLRLPCHVSSLDIVATHEPDERLVVRLVYTFSLLPTALTVLFEPLVKLSIGAMNAMLSLVVLMAQPDCAALSVADWPSCRWVDVVLLDIRTTTHEAAVVSVWI